MTQTRYSRPKHKINNDILVLIISKLYNIDDPIYRESPRASTPNPRYDIIDYESYIHIHRGKHARPCHGGYSREAQMKGHIAFIRKLVLPVSALGLLDFDESGSHLVSQFRPRTGRGSI